MSRVHPATDLAGQPGPQADRAASKSRKRPGPGSCTGRVKRSGGKSEGCLAIPSVDARMHGCTGIGSPDTTRPAYAGRFGVRRKNDWRTERNNSLADSVASRERRQGIKMSDRIKISRILSETEDCLEVQLSTRQSRLVSNMLGAMKLRMPEHTWHAMPPEALSALHLRNLIDSGAMPSGSLNARGWGALQFANEMIEEGKRVMAATREDTHEKIH